MGSARKAQAIKLIGGIFLAVGLVVAAIGAYFFIGTQDLLQNGQRSTGKVVELRKAPTARYFSTVVEFETTAQGKVTAISKMGSNPPAHKVGDSVTVFYRAQSPEDILLDEPLELWFLSGLFGGIGLIFCTIGGGVLISILVANAGRIEA